ncbi:aminotransferase class IV [Quadrisphaera sp. DSM 44207]|uniref:aminotransferase class IV n=1 Tax=Quadrisphaera sp. DSM 44207 TaxID=1881057 RepID=UPI0008866A78|nr:aminotransferase class IV [Quadrisphaera sp. DSM 44207]SDQ48809.1 branched-chain amino acid aminotransferase [Quadrisphaera sp. DSM 44207]
MSSAPAPSARRPGAAVPAAVWVDGALVPDGHPAVHALDHGLVVGDGVFETCKVVDGRPFALTLHLRRLERSAAGLGLAAPEEDVVRAAVREVLAALGPAAASARLRITATSGPGPLGSERVPGAGTLVVAAAPLSPWPAGARAVTVPWTRNERSAVAGLKTTSYAENVVALARARERGASEALLANTRGQLCEGTGSNVVVAVGDELLTPPLASGCLAGTSRLLLLRWAAQEGLPVREADLPYEELGRAPEVLLTSSTRDVQPLAAVDDRPLTTSALGRAAVELFARRAAQDDDPQP